VSSTATLEKQGDFVCAKLLSIALIGPNESRRWAVSSVIAEYPAISVCEFSSYPTNLGTVSRLLAREFDMIVVDLDSDPKVALHLVESIRGETQATVIPYTEEADPEVMARCTRAGAREYLVLPVRQSTLDRIFARARIGLPSDAQPVSKPGPQIVAVAKTDVRRNDPPPVCAPVHTEVEDLEQTPRQVSGQAAGQATALATGQAAEQTSGKAGGRASRGNGTEQDSQPVVASREQVTDRGNNVVSSSLIWPGGVVVEEIRFTPKAGPLAARGEDEDSAQKLRTADTGNSDRPATTLKWATFLSGASVAPALSNRAVVPAAEREDILHPIQETAEIETDQEISFLSFHSDLADLGDEDPDRKKWVRIGAASFAALVLLLFVGPRLFTPAKHTLAAQSAQTSPVANDPEPAAKTAKPRPSRKLDEGHASATADSRQISIPQPATNVEEAVWPKGDSKPAPATNGTVPITPGTNSASSQVDSTMMSDQLATAPRIPQDVKAPHKQEAPPPAGFDAANTEEMGSGARAVNSVLTGQARSTVKVVPPPAPPVVIPVKVADKLLIRKTLPTYPPSAWNHYVSGKVVLDAVVSETGSVESVKVVSGPKVFEQAALDAVKTWRYKPYLVNDRPARVQTTVTLDFNPYR
jgi:periplasmic protein TonB